MLVPGGLIHTAQSILEERGPSSLEGKDSRGWLASSDEETVILLGLMSDVSDETMALNRFFDQDQLDKSAIHMEVDSPFFADNHMADRGQRGAGDRLHKAPSAVSASAAYHHY